MTALIISCIVFVFTMTLVTVMLLLFGRVQERQNINAILKNGHAGATSEEKDQENSRAARFKRRFVVLLRRFRAYTKPKKEEELSRIEKLFASAGFRKRPAVATFFGAKVFLAVLLPIVSLAAVALCNLAVSFYIEMILFVFSLAAGFYLPDIWLQLSLQKRREQIMKGFPDALDLLVICVESGMGLDAAITRVGEEIRLSSPAVGDELKLLTLELRAGKSRHDALKNFGARSGLEDLKYLANLLIQTDRLGTSIAQALRVHADSLRVKKFQSAEEKAIKLPVKMLLPLILCIFPSLFLVILGPPVLQVLRLFHY